MSDRLRAAIRRMWLREEEQQWVYGKMGRRSGTSYIFDVPGRATFVYVTIRTSSGAQTVVPARNDAGVEHAPRLNVKMKLEAGVYVIHGRTGDQTQGINPVTPPTGVLPHNHDERYFTEDEHVNAGSGVADAGLPIVLDATGLIDPSFIPPADLVIPINAAPEQTTLEDDNRIPMVDTDGTDTLKWFSYDRIKDAILALASALFAPIANGVTNGNTHDHVGGDGNQIDHTGLSNIGTNSHAVIDSHIAAAAAHGATGAVVGTTNAQTLTNKTLDSTNISGLTAKNPPVDADSVVIVDSAASNVFKAVTWANIKAVLTTLFDGLFVHLTGNETVAGVKTWSDAAGFGGTPGPNHAIDVQPGAKAVAARFRAGNTGIAYNQFTPADASSEWGNFAAQSTHLIFVHNSGYLQFTANGAERMRILADGKIAIGLSSVNANLLGIKAGSSSNDAAVGGTLYETYTTVGQVGAGPDVLQTYSVPANTLAVNGQSIRFEAAGSFDIPGPTGTVTIEFGGTTIATITASLNSNWYAHGRIYRSGPTSQVAIVHYGTNEGYTVSARTTPAETLSGAITFRIRGNSTAGANDDTTCWHFFVAYDDANT